MVVRSLKCLTILFSCNMLHDLLISWHWYVYTWHLIPDIWYLTLIFDMLSLDTWSLILDIWYWYLTCYHLIVNTWHLISDTWQLICYHLTLDTCYLVLIHLTWCCDTWPDIITPDTCITLSIHDYHFYEDLTWLLYCYQTSGTPELLYSWTPETGRLLILYS